MSAETAKRDLKMAEERIQQIERMVSARSACAPAIGALLEAEHILGRARGGIAAIPKVQQRAPLAKRAGALARRLSHLEDRGIAACVSQRSIRGVRR